MPVNVNRALCCLVKPGDQLYQRTLGSAGLAYDPNCLAWTDVEGNIRKHVFGRIRMIFKIYVVKADITLFHF